jgi:hypothetical protein
MSLNDEMVWLHPFFLAYTDKSNRCIFLKLALMMVVPALTERTAQHHDLDV